MYGVKIHKISKKKLDAYIKLNGGYAHIHNIVFSSDLASNNFI